MTSPHCGRTMKPFFHLNPEIWAWADTLWGIWGIFGQTMSTHFGIRPCFPLPNHYSYKKLSLYIHIPNIHLGLGFEFGP